MAILSSPSETSSLSGKTAIVTGGSRGIGRAIAIHFARKGITNLAITYVSNKAAAEYTLEQTRTLGVKQAIAIQADATDPTLAPRLIKEVLSGLNTTTIDILVNNAVLTDISKTSDVSKLAVEAFSETMIANVFSPVTLTTAFMEHAPKYGGRVINISSVASKTGNSNPIITYGASKAALDSFTRSFAETFSSDRSITFNSVAVGPTETDALAAARATIPEIIDKQKDYSTAAPRLGEPEDVAYIVGFLASEEGRWVNGAAVSANGGHRQTLALFG
ncbi:3-oxoacyl-[acyl-carrier-protein] reductase 12 [Colletotrichum chlorophyti]|uniref:3-oxoacyl-[acyl-carrier-protein] reductase 12 n=1 Tax=Colletotrichum chlorophyti TaxID=708187 RepID=A0A1Q8RXK1_9PEZI|nr:3-oxoacyl-[acyl-carrier-protein] reductase 12 [Colletotrichum chlorophyti]